MFLSDTDIKSALKRGQITVDPLLPDSIKGSSVDLHLGKHFKIYRQTRRTAIDLRRQIDDMMDDVEIGETEAFILQPGDFALSVLLNTTGVDNEHMGFLDGKSSIGRVGTFVHITASGLDPGNKLQMTLELYNATRLAVPLFYRMPVAQMRFARLTSPAEQSYSQVQGSGKYYGDTKPQASQYWKNFHNGSNSWMTEQQKRFLLTASMEELTRYQEPGKKTRK